MLNLSVDFEQAARVVGFNGHTFRYMTKMFIIKGLSDYGSAISLKVGLLPMKYSE